MGEVGGTQDFNLSQSFVMDDKGAASTAGESPLQPDSNGIKEIRVCVCGRTGEGKSQLCNSLVGSNEFIVSDGLDPETQEVEFHEFEWEHEGSKLKLEVYDTPGFFDGNDADKYLNNIKQKCPYPQVILYCISCSSNSVSRDKSTITTLGKVFGPAVLEHIVLISTHADVLSQGKEGINEATWREEYSKKTGGRRDSLRRTLKSALQDKEVPVIFSGLSEMKKIRGDQHNRPWLAQVLYEILKQVGELSSFKALIVTHPYVEYTDYLEEVLKTSDSKPPQSNNGNQSNKAVVGVSAVGGGATAVIGAGVCATIGALAIGAPTFGVAAGAGLVIGGVIGGSIGAVVGGAGAKLATSSKDNFS